MNGVIRGLAVTLLIMSFLTTYLYINKEGLSSCMGSSTINLLEGERIVASTAPSKPSDDLPSFQGFEKLMEYVQIERKRRIRNVCQKTKPKVSLAEATDTLKHILVDDKYKLLYCYVPKVACTNWKKVLLVLQGTFNKSASEIQSRLVHNNSLYSSLSQYRPAERKYRLDNYFKFMFARDPMERILSAFRNKFEDPYTVNFQMRYGREIALRYRKNPTPQALAMGNDVTFGEFAQFVADETINEASRFNEHWERYHKLCSPCSVDYNYIGLYETLEADTTYIMNKRNISKLVSLPKQGKYQGRTGQLMDAYFQKLSPSVMRRLKELYSLDYDLFGYSE